MKILNLVDESTSEIKYKISKFPDGQQNIVLLRESFMGMGIILIEPIQIKSRLNNWLDLELITCAVACLRGIDRDMEIHLYVPYVVGARSDRKFEEGGNNYLKDIICPAINALKCKTVTVLDPHSDCLEMGIKGFRKLDNSNLVINIIGAGEDCDYYKNIILVSPDAGASKKIYKLAEQIGYKGDIITCSKDRDKDGKLTKCVVPINLLYHYAKDEHNPKDYIIIDDICDGGATFINIAKEILSKYSDIKPKIYLIVTHGIFSKGINELNRYFNGMYCTNSYKQFSIDEMPLIRNKQLDIF